MKVSQKSKNYGNACLIYGGGLCPLAAEGINCAAKYLVSSKMFKKVFVGAFSFLSLTTKSLIKEWKSSNYDQHYSGGYFGTCRNVDLTEVVKQSLAIDVCKELKIKWVFVIGGDGSSRQVSEIANDFHEHGINFVFLMPFTIDGINGGASVGLRPAVEVSMWVIEQTTNTFLRTLEGAQLGGAIFELQGRNRDDILIQVLRKLSKQKRIGDYPRGKVKILAIPANLPLLPSNLETQIAQSAVTPEKPVIEGIRGVPTVILLSEGAHIKKDAISKIASNYGMKYRSFSIGHLSQMNDCIGTKDRNMLDAMMEKAVKLCCENLIGEPFTIVFEDEMDEPRIEPISYFAELNPRQAQQQLFSVDDEKLLKKYMP